MAKTTLNALGERLPLISIIMPVYNSEKFIRHTLESVRRQTYRNLEVLMIDDGSTDGTARILSEYVELDRRFHMIQVQNGGASAARNVGLEAATGEWLGFADSDDELPPKAIETLYLTAHKHHTAIAMGAYNECHKGTHGTMERRVGAHPAVLRTAEAAQRYFLTHGVNLNHMWTKLFRRDVFEHVRFPVGVIYEDIYVMPYLLEAAGSCAVVNRVVYHYMVRSGSLSTSLNIRTHMDGIRVRLNTAQFMREHYPDLVGLANDSVLPLACNVLGKIEHIGRDKAPEEWNETIELVKKVLPECSLQNPLYKVGAWTFQQDPTLISKISHFTLMADKMI